MSPGVYLYFEEDPLYIAGIQYISEAEIISHGGISGEEETQSCMRASKLLQDAKYVNSCSCSYLCACFSCLAKAVLPTCGSPLEAHSHLQAL